MDENKLPERRTSPMKIQSLSVVIPNTRCIKFGTTSFWIQKQDDGKFHFQMDSSEPHLSRKDLKLLVLEIEQALSE